MLNAKRDFLDNGAKSFPNKARETSIDRYRSLKCLSLLFLERTLKTIMVGFLTKFGRIIGNRIHACMVKLSFTLELISHSSNEKLMLNDKEENYGLSFLKGIMRDSYQSLTARYW